MKQEQLDFLKEKVKKQIDGYSNGSIPCSSDCYTPVNKDPIKNKIEKYINNRIESFDNALKYAQIFYNANQNNTNTHEENLTIECEKGKNFLEADGHIPPLFISWFIESYGPNENQKEFTDKAKEYLRSKSIRNKIVDNIDRSNNYNSELNI